MFLYAVVLKIKTLQLLLDFIFLLLLLFSFDWEANPRYCACYVSIISLNYRLKQDLAQGFTILPRNKTIEIY